MKGEVFGVVSVEEGVEGVDAARIEVGEWWMRMLEEVVVELWEREGEEVEDEEESEVGELDGFLVLL